MLCAYVIIILLLLVANAKSLDLKQVDQLIITNNKAMSMVNCHLAEMVMENETFNDPDLILNWEVWVQNQKNQLQQIVYMTDFSFGQAFFSCPSIIPYGSRPFTVHQLHPADIDVVIDIGDLQQDRWRRNCRQFKCILEAPNAYQSFIVTKRPLTDQISISGIIEQFNRNVITLAVENNIQNERINTITSSVSLQSQVRVLLREIQSRNLQNKWKLVNLIIGINEVPCSCLSENVDVTQLTVDNVYQALVLLRDNLPGTYVNLVNVVNPTFWRVFWRNSPFCERWLNKCYFSSTAAKALTRLDQKLIEMTKSKEMQTDNFTVNMQYLFTKDLERQPEMQLLSLDCIHLNRIGLTSFSRALWNNMLKSNENKLPFNGTAQKLICPNDQCPFLRTSWNNDNCGTYLEQRFVNIGVALPLRSSSSMNNNNQILYMLLHILCSIYLCNDFI